MKKDVVLTEMVRVHSKGDWLNAPTVERLAEWLGLSIDDVIEIVEADDDLVAIAAFQTDDGMIEFDKENYIVIHTDNMG